MFDLGKNSQHSLNIKEVLQDIIILTICYVIVDFSFENVSKFERFSFSGSVHGENEELYLDFLQDVHYPLPRLLRDGKQTFSKI